jgi:hypothetical protein
MKSFQAILLLTLLPPLSAVAQSASSTFPLTLNIERSAVTDFSGGDVAAAAQADHNGMASPVSIMFFGNLNGENHWVFDCQKENSHGESNQCTDLARGAYPARWMHNKELLQIVLDGKEVRFLNVSPNPNNPPADNDPVALSSAAEFSFVKPKSQENTDYPLLVHVYGASRLRFQSGELPARMDCSVTTLSSYRTNVRCTASDPLPLYEGYVDVDATIDGNTRSFLYCEAKWRWSKCSVVGPGLYPARWKDNKHAQIMLLGTYKDEPFEIGYSVNHR